MSVQQGSAGGMPVLILKEGASQTKGRDAQKNNIAAAKLISEVVKELFGPKRHGQDVSRWIRGCNNYK